MTGRTAQRRSDGDDVEVVEAFVWAVHGRAQVGNASGLEVDDLVDDLASKTGDRMGLALSLARTVSKVWADMLGRGGATTAAAASVDARLAEMLRAADQQGAVFDTTALTQAREVVDGLQAEQQSTVAGLEAAVLAGDVDEVLRLRTQSEAVLPNRLAQARVTVVQEELKLAEASTARPARRSRAAREEREAAQAKVVKAAKALEAAQQAVWVAGWWESLAEGTHSHVTLEVERLTALLETQKVEATQGQADRLRKLAGLPASTSLPQQQASSSTPSAPVIYARRAPVFTETADVEDVVPEQVVSRPVLNQIAGAR